MRTLVCLLVVCAVAAHASPVTLNAEGQWEQFKLKHNKVYPTESEHEFRFKIFVDNLRKIAEHNKAFDEGKSTYRMGVTKFADLLQSEFVEKYLSRGKDVRESNVERKAPGVNQIPPQSMDWRKRGAVTPIKDQGNCGSCWSFAGTGAMEGAHYLATGNLVSLSEQNLMDCSWSAGNHGCGGGLEYLGWDYVIANNGLDTEEAYPYEAVDGSCRYDPSGVGATITSYQHLPRDDESALLEAVAFVGPIAIGIDAGGFYLYESGIFEDPECSSYYLNHSVLCVGYGVENGVEYWLVKNSWGSSFGEDGFIKMIRNRSNMCGVAADASYPII